MESSDDEQMEVEGGELMAKGLESESGESLRSQLLSEDELTKSNFDDKGMKY